MHLPNLKEARKRSNKEVKEIEVDLDIPKKFIGKKYFLKKESISTQAPWDKISRVA